MAVDLETFRPALGRLARHPLLRRARGAARDAWWSIRGRAVRNPALPAAPRRLLFVCQGNICRSPFAALLAARELQAVGIEGVECVSAGYRVSQEASSPEAARRAASAFNVSLQEHRPTALHEELVSSSDAVLVMEPAHLERVRRSYPAHRHRIHLLSLFEPVASRPGGYARYAIADPYGQPVEVFEACYERITRAVRGLVSAISGGTAWGRA